jgi:hypothetical protein
MFVFWVGALFGIVAPVQRGVSFKADCHAGADPAAAQQMFRAVEESEALRQLLTAGPAKWMETGAGDGE